MARLRKFAFRPIALAAVAAAASSLSTPQAQAGFNLDGGTNFAVLYEGNGGNTLNYNNSTVTGNIGIGATGTMALSGPGTITGDVDFNGTSNIGTCSAPCGVVDGVTITGAVNQGVSAVNTALTGAGGLNSLSQTLGLETGTALTISSGGALNTVTTPGMTDGSGNEVYTLQSASNFPNGTFTITGNGTGTETVVVNVPFSFSFNGSIVLAGGLTSDQVLFNLTPTPPPPAGNLTTYNNDYTTLSGGPTLTISTSGLTTTGTYLDPTGSFQINHSILDGRIFGGDTTNAAIVSGANIFAPPTPVVPEPASLTLLGTALAGLGVALRRRRRLAGSPSS